MNSVLSLKWKNHCSAFVQLLSIIRGKQMYTDVTLACSGKFYNAHKIVLTACSDYFKGIFEHIDCKNPVIVLKDVNCVDIESLLDYMYIGEVSVKQENLSSLILAAECLKIKGLAVPDDPLIENSRKVQSISEKRNISEVNKDSEIIPRKLKNIRIERVTYTNEDKFSESVNENEAESDMSIIKEEFVDNECHTFTEQSASCNENIFVSTYQPNASSSKIHERSFFEESLLSNASNSQENLEYQDSDSSLNLSTSSDYVPHDNEKSVFYNKLALDEQSQKFNQMKKCTFCPKIFSSRSKLNSHLRVHTGEKPYSCSYCSTQFTQKTSLKRHLLAAHNLELPTREYTMINAQQ